jgi:hypothetical protein
LRGSPYYHRAVRGFAWLLFACGCNQVFGLRETVAVDAQQFDAPIDAPYACPAPGTQPGFGKLLHQSIAKNCISYTTSATANRAAAYCLDLDAIADGVVDGALEPTTLVPNDKLDWPRLTPEGDELWVRRRGGGIATFAVYRYDSDHHWTWVRDLAIANTAQDDVITAPSRQVDGKRRFIRYAFAEFKLYEYEDDGATTTPVRSYNVQTELGVYYMQFPNLDADGLRLVFVGQVPAATFAQTMYADRPSRADSFSAAMPLVTAPVAYDPFLTPDCSRLYTSGLGSIFFAQQ